MYNALEAARLTKVTPFDPLTLSVGVLQAGAVGNVIPNDLTFGGTVRLFNREEVGLPFYEYMKEMIEGIAKAYGLHGDLLHLQAQLPGLQRPRVR